MSIEVRLLRLSTTLSSCACALKKMVLCSSDTITFYFLSDPMGGSRGGRQGVRTQSFLDPRNDSPFVGFFSMFFSYSLYFSLVTKCFLCTNKKGADRPALLHRLISIFIVHFLDPTAAIQSRSKISILKPVYVAGQVDERLI